MMHLPGRVVCRYLIILLCCLPRLTVGQVSPSSGTLYITKDSLSYKIEEKHWRFSPADVPNGADTALDDSSWPLVDSRMYVRHDTVAHGFRGIGWLRLHFVTDSSLARQALALVTRQSGASEIYLDGRLLSRYGRLTPKDSAQYYNPQDMPLSMPVLRAGPHVLAIRYANWAFIHNKHRYEKTDAGFDVAIWEANAAMESYTTQHAVLLFGFVLLFGIFITLSLIHLILYLYYRADKANGRFSLFAACAAMLFLIPAVRSISDNALLILNLNSAGLILIAVTGFSLSYLLNSLFSKRRWHFYVVVVTCVAMIITVIFWRESTAFGLLGVIVLVPLEALYILVSAVWRRLPGARIIGSGLMLLILLLLAVISIIAVQGDIYIGEDSLSGQIFFLVLILAILSIPISMSMYLAWRFSVVNRDLTTQLQQVETLGARAREQEAEKQRLLETRQEELEREVAARTEEVRRQHADLIIAKRKSDDLLLNILPVEVAEELKETGKSVARLYNDVSVLFTDFVDFTQMSMHLSPAALVAEIDHCFQAFDGIITRHGLEKIKTVGDAYIAVSGLPVTYTDHAKKVVAAALEIRAFIQARKESLPQTFGIRLGVHSGPVVAGIVGVKKFAYDIWGDTVNTAARMEQHGEEGKLNISGATYELVKDDFTCIFRGELEAKHKGKMGMYFVE